ncbi:MAG: hypothetical protein U0797_02300 [Gemmataceae bacterium]
MADVVKRKGNVIRIEIVGEAMKPEELKALSEKIKELVPGENRKVTVTVGAGASIYWAAPRVAEVAKAPKAPKPPEAPRPAEAGPRGQRGDGERRLENLERRLEGIMRELESMRKEMRGPARRQGPGDGSGRIERRDPEGAQKDGSRTRERERSREEAK